MQDKNLVTVNLTNEMKTLFIDYAMSVLLYVLLLMYVMVLSLYTDAFFME